MAIYILKDPLQQGYAVLIPKACYHEYEVVIVKVCNYTLNIFEVNK